jgi:integrase
MAAAPADLSSLLDRATAEAAVLAECATSTLREALRLEKLNGFKRGPRQWLIYGQDLANWAKGTPFERPPTNSLSQIPNGQYCVYVKEPGQERRRFGLEVPLDQPESEAYAVLNEWVRRRQAAQFVQKGGTIGELWDLYIAEKELEKKVKYCRDTRWLWNANLAPVFAALTAADLTAPRMVNGRKANVCYAYAEARHKAGARRATIYHELNTLRTIMNWGAAETRKLVPKTEVFVPRRAKPRPNQLEPHHFELVFRATDEPHIKLFMLLAITTTARMSAILELTWDRVDFKNRTIDYRIDRDQDDILDSSGKKGRAKVDMGELLYRVLSDQKRFAKTDHVIEFRGKPMQSVRKGIYRAFKRAGVEGQFLGAHALRHAGATWLANNGTDMQKIQRLMGHEDIKSTELIYADHSRGYLKQVVDFPGRNSIAGREPGSNRVGPPDDHPNPGRTHPKRGDLGSMNLRRFQVRTLSPCFCWSEWSDSNTRPPRPERGALPGCATLR